MGDYWLCAMVGWFTRTILAWVIVRPLQILLLVENHSPAWLLAC